MALVLGCKVSNWPIPYLGLPLGENTKADVFWDSVIERVLWRLDGWKKVYLSWGGKITLIHSCLSHFPNYFLSMSKIPSSVVLKIEKLQMDFLWWWSRFKENNRDHLVSWDLVCKAKGGSGIIVGRISIRIHVLLEKWLWRFPKERYTLYETHTKHSQVVTSLSLEDHCTGLSKFF